MTQAKFLAATVGGTADEVEAAFYEALQNADLTQLMACWADEDDVVCVAPGGPRLVGGAAIRAAFEAIFARGAIQGRVERIRKVEALASAVHNVLQRVEVPTAEGTRQAWVVATNVYHKTAQGWRLVTHHASHSAPPDEAGAHPTSQVLH